jgi:uncharacterized protein involved in cysteine biosynthesis
MAPWKFWDWVAYTGIWVAAVILAADAGLKGSPTLMESIPNWLKWEYWPFVPLALLSLSAFCGTRVC